MAQHDDNGKADAPGAGAKAAHDRSEERPTPIPPRREGLPPLLTVLRQWVVWRYEWKDRLKKWDKPPLNPATRKNASVSDPKTWGTFDAAWDSYLSSRGKLDGVGLVLVEDNNLVGIDLDSCRDPETGAIAEWARNLVDLLETYTEVSPSGTGLRLFLRGRLPADCAHSKEYATGKVEVFVGGKYLTVTGVPLDATPAEVHERPEALGEMLALVFGPGERAGAGFRMKVPPGPDPSRLTDEQLLEKARQAKNGAYFSQLWGGDTSACGGDHSAADMALCCLLAFWTSRDVPRMDRLFRRSGLIRDKWDEKRGQETYGQRTLRRACEFTRDVFGDPASPGATGAAGSGAAPPEPEPWSAPIPLDSPIEVPPFPVDVFPQQLRRLVEEAACAFHCPLDFVGVPLLVLASGALANARHIAITRSHSQAPCLYAAPIGSPGTAKTTPVKYLRRPFDRVQARLLATFEQELAIWQDAEKEERGPAPTLQQIIVSDITTESFKAVLRENPRGALLVRNELSGLMEGMNQHKGGRGDDRQFYLDLFDGIAHVSNRKSDRRAPGGVTFVMDPFGSVLGTLQPDVLPFLRGQMRAHDRPRDDGFLDRFLLTYPPEMPAVGERWLEVSRESEEAWRLVVERLLSLEMAAGEEGRPTPVLVPLTEDARTAWQRITQRLADERNAEDFPPHLHGPWAKLKTFAARLALVMHFLRWACGEGVDANRVDADSLDRAGRLVDYFKPHVRKVHAAMESDPHLPGARKVLQWIRRERKTEFKSYEPFRDLRSKTLMPSQDAVDRALEVLGKYRWVREKDQPQRPGSGRKPSPTYEVNPAALNPSKESKESKESPAPDPSAGHSFDSLDSLDGSGMEQEAFRL